MQLSRTVLTIVMALALACVSGSAAAESGAEIDRKATAALHRLYETTPVAKKLGNEAVAILVFPEIGKAGFLVAAEYGVGSLHKGGKNVGFYSIAELSGGYQAGIEKFSYALFFMTEEAVAYLDKSGGFSLGAGPSLTVVDAGFAKSFTSTTVRSDVYAFSFGEQGLMGGVGLKGSKITRYHPK